MEKHTKDKIQLELENWKQDFPYHKQNATLVGRREFAKMLTFVSGGLAGGTCLVAAKEHVFPREYVAGRHLICRAADVPKGGTRAFVLEGSSIPYILIHLEDDSFRAYEQKCTHLSCSVYYEPGTGHIVCPCHKGYFDAGTGEVLAGPPPRKLPRLQVSIEEGNIFVSTHSSES